MFNFISNSMKKMFCLLAVVTVLAASCKRAPVQTAGSPLETGDGQMVEMLFGTNIRTDVTKAPVDAWNNQDIFVLGYERNPYTELNPTDLSEPYIDCVKAIAPATGTSGSIEVLDEEGLPFYYGYRNNAYVTYDFYGCYFADAADVADVVKTESSVYVPFTIDGTQDIMTAAADRATDVVNPQTQENIVPVNYAYSGYSARKGVTPNIKFEHRLTRFNFFVKNCSTTGIEVVLDSVKFTSIPSGNLYVANILDGGPLGVVADNVPAEALSLVLPSQTVDLMPESAETALGSMMVIPAELHQLTMYFHQPIPGVELSKKLSISHDVLPSNVVTTSGEIVTEFKPGFQYDIHVKLYGLEPIEINVELVDWVPGGEVTLDPDDNPMGN